ncbi:MAG TPA: C40 family peptidase [Xanthobacteraceae bacterium]|nr:C40 family peptidase [Xanthobacteraceae bacterium]
MTAFDKRVTPARPDLAAIHLRGQIEAERYAEGVVMQVIDVTAPLRSAPSPEAGLDTEALHGERVVVYEETDEGWSWGQLVRDGYVGWLPSNALAKESAEATHRVSALRTFVFPRPDIKSPPVASLCFGCAFAVRAEQENFFVEENGGFIPRQHVVPLSFRESDPVEVARRFLGTPYLWGGKTSAGLDCSGLVQLALQSTGQDYPRDTDMQQEVGFRVAGREAHMQRGDLIFWKGHVGICAGDGMLLHANAFHMAVAEEPLTEAIRRIGAGGSEIVCVRRP